MNLQRTIYSLLTRIEDSILLIESQTKHIKKADKSIDAKTESQYLINYPEIPWTDIMGLRNIIAHEYHRIDEDEIFRVITSDLQPLLKQVQKMKSEL